MKNDDTGFETRAGKDGIDFAPIEMQSASEPGGWANEGCGADCRRFLGGFLGGVLGGFLGGFLVGFLAVYFAALFLLGIEREERDILNRFRECALSYLHLPKAGRS